MKRWMQFVTCLQLQKRAGGKLEVALPEGMMWLEHKRVKSPPRRPESKASQPSSLQLFIVHIDKVFFSFPFTVSVGVKSTNVGVQKSLCTAVCFSSVNSTHPKLEFLLQGVMYEKCRWTEIIRFDEE